MTPNISQARVLEVLKTMSAPVRAGDLVGLLYGDVPSWKFNDCRSKILTRLAALERHGEVLSYMTDRARYWFTYEVCAHE